MYDVMNRQKIEKGSNYWSIVTQSIKPISSSIYVGRGNIPAPFFSLWVKVIHPKYSK